MPGKIKKLFMKEQFNPSLLGIFINPFYFARKGLFKGIIDFLPELKGNLLDVGCGSKPYEAYCSVNTYVGLEIDTPENRKNKKADYYYDGKTFPFKNTSFDSLMCNQVFEHIFNPSEFLMEINRVLKSGGTILMTVPFIWDEHEQPYDFARYSSFGIMSLLERNGFQIIRSKKSMNDIRVIFQLLNAYLYKKASSNYVYLSIANLFLMSPINLIGEVLSKILPENDDLYLDNVILAKKVKNVNAC